MNGPLFNPYGKSMEILGTVYQPAADRITLFVLLVGLNSKKRWATCEPAECPNKSYLEVSLSVKSLT